MSQISACHLLWGFIDSRKVLNVHSRCQKNVDLVWVPTVKYNTWKIKMYVLLYMNVESSIMYDSPKLGTTRTYINRCIDKQVVVNPCNILLSSKKDQAIETSNSLDRSQNNYIERSLIKRSAYYMIPFR